MPDGRALGEKGVDAFAGILGQHKIGISSVIQPEAHEEACVPLVLMIHDATHAQMQKALDSLKGVPVDIEPSYPLAEK